VLSCASAECLDQHMSCVLPARPCLPCIVLPCAAGPDATCHTVLCFGALSILNGPEAASTKQPGFAVVLSLTPHACETCRSSQCKQSIFAVLSSLVTWHAGRSPSFRASISQAQALCSCPEAGRQAPYCPRAKCSCSQHGSRQLWVRLHDAAWRQFVCHACCLSHFVLPTSAQAASFSAQVIA